MSILIFKSFFWLFTYKIISLALVYPHSLSGSQTLGFGVLTVKDLSCHDSVLSFITLTLNFSFKATKISYRYGTVLF